MIHLTPEEESHILERRQRQRDARSYNQGVLDSVNEILALSKMGCGGAGIVSPGDQNLADHLKKALWRDEV